MQVIFVSFSLEFEGFVLSILGRRDCALSFVSLTLKWTETSTSSFSLGKAKGIETLEIFLCLFGFSSMAFRCGQNIHIIKYEMENTNNLSKGVNGSICINTKSRILKGLSK